MNNNPQQMVLQAIEKNTNPMLGNLIKMAREGNTKGVEDFARNIYKERGKDFDKEFAEFMKSFK